MKRAMVFGIVVLGAASLGWGVEFQADLVLTKDTNPPGAASVIAGQVLTYRVTSTNEGPDAADNIQIYDETPSDTWHSAVTPSAGGSCNVVPTGLGGSEVTCSWAGATAVAASRYIDFEVSVCSEKQCLTDVVSDLAQTWSDTSDPLPGNNMQVGYSGLGMVAAVTTPVETQSEFSMTMSGGSGAHPGGHVTYTIWVKNEGPSSAEIALTDILPAGWTVVSGETIYSGSCGGVGTGVLNCGPIYLGGSAICAPIWIEETITLVVAVPPGEAEGTYTNSAGISSNNCLGDLGDVSAFQYTEVGLFADGFESGDPSAWSTSVP